MLTIVHSPAKYNFSRNPNYVEITTDNYKYTDNLGVKAACGFVGLDAAIVNNTLTVSYGPTPTTIVFTFKSSTNILANQIAIKTGGQTVEQYITQVANDLNTHAGFSALFYASPYYNTLFVMAKQAGLAYDLSSSSSTVTGVGYYNQPGTDDVQTIIRPNYAIRLNLQYYNGSNWVTVIETQQEPVNNKVKADLKEYINSILSYNLPNFASPTALNNSFKCPGLLKKFRVLLSEVYGTPPVVQSTTAIPGGDYSGTVDNVFYLNEYYSLKAGFDAISSKLKPSNQLSYYFTNNAFLTRQARTKNILRDQREWLYYLFQFAITGGVVVRYRLYDRFGQETIEYGAPNPGTWIGDDDGIEEVGEYTSYDIAAYDLIAFPVNRPGDSFATNKAYLQMKVDLVKQSDNTDVVSETFTYIFDDEPKPAKKYIYFVNTDGGLDTVRLYGSEELKSLFERDVIDTLNTADNTSFVVQSKVMYSEKSNTGVLFSGWKTLDEIKYIDDLLMSHYALMYNNIYGQAVEIPIIITSKELVVNKTNQNLRGYVIEYTEAIRSELPQAKFYPIV